MKNSNILNIFSVFLLFVISKNCFSEAEDKLGKIDRLRSELPTQAKIIPEAIHAIWQEPNMRDVVYSKVFSGNIKSGYLAIHFMAGSNKSKVPWKIFFKSYDGNKILKEYSSQSLEFANEEYDAFWTEELPSHKVRMEVIANEIPDGFELAIDKWLFEDKAESFKRIRDLENPQIELVNINTVPDEYKKQIKSVFRLDIEDPERTYPCTGFLVSTNLIATAAHCIPKSLSIGDECKSAIRIWLDDYDSMRMWATQAKCGKVEDLDLQKDFAILSIADLFMEERGYSKFSDQEPKVGDRLYIIHHPDGRPASLTRNNCYVAEVPIPSETYPDVPCDGDIKFLYHTCDTLGGSSGAPIFNSTSGNVVAMQTSGFAPFISLDALRVNCGISSHEIKLKEAYQKIW